MRLVFHIIPQINVFSGTISSNFGSNSLIEIKNTKYFSYPFLIRYISVYPRAILILACPG